MCRRTFLIISVFLFLSSSIHVFELKSGSAVSVIDGDTIEIRRDKQTDRIRLFGIDCPEKGQPYGRFAKKLTSKLVFRKTVVYQTTDQDRYGRTVALVSVNDKCLNEELVKAGAACYYTRYSSDRNLADAELYACGHNLDLWRESDAIPPWEHRYNRRLSQVSQTALEKGEIVYCGNLKSRNFGYIRISQQVEIL